MDRVDNESKKAHPAPQHKTKFLSFCKICPRCTKLICNNDWDVQERFCTGCAPRVNVEVAAAKAEKAVQDIREKAAKTQVFTGEIESKQTICPRCGKPAGEGKFCTNCGAPLGLVKCPKCGTQNPAGTKFCGECGTKLGIKINLKINRRTAVVKKNQISVVNPGGLPSDPVSIDPKHILKWWE